MSAEKASKKVSFNETVEGATVRSLCKKFESLLYEAPLRRPVAMRSQTMRNSSTSQNRRALMVPKVISTVNRQSSEHSGAFDKVWQRKSREWASKQEPAKPNADELYENLRTRTISKAFSVGSLNSKHSGYSSGFSSSENEYEWTVKNQQNEGLTREEPFSRIQMIIMELLENEIKYISHLRQGIEAYVIPFNSVSLPDTLIGKRLIIFSNIEKIHEFHERSFLPLLVDCGYDPEKIADAFTSTIEAHHFDSYIEFVQNKSKSAAICKQNAYFFMQLDNDRLGVNSFLLQPIQRLPRYRLIISELVKELMRDVKANQKAISRCCVAEKNIYKLLVTVNEHCR